jgi:hypothetical protein
MHHLGWLVLVIAIQLAIKGSLLSVIAFIISSITASLEIKLCKWTFLISLTDIPSTRWSLLWLLWLLWLMTILKSCRYILYILLELIQLLLIGWGSRWRLGHLILWLLYWLLLLLLGLLLLKLTILLECNLRFSLSIIRSLWDIVSASLVQDREFGLFGRGTTTGLLVLISIVQWQLDFNLFSLLLRSSVQASSSIGPKVLCLLL